MEVVILSFRLIDPLWLASTMMHTDGISGVLEDLGTAPIGQGHVPELGKRHSRGSDGPMLNVVPAAISAASCWRTSLA